MNEQRSVIINGISYTKLNYLKDTYIKSSKWDELAKKTDYYKMSQSAKKELSYSMLYDFENDNIMRQCSYDKNYYNIKDFLVGKNKTRQVSRKNLNILKREKSKRLVNKNLPIIRKIFSGNPDKKIIYMNEDLENCNPFKSHDFIPLVAFDMHHVCFKNHKSGNKLTKEPSKYYNTINLTDLSTSFKEKTEGINQLLLCQVMSKNAHYAIHKHLSSDNIQRYLNYPEIYGTSYHFLDKNNYNDCIDFIIQYGYNKNELLSYDDVMEISMEYEPSNKLT